MSGDSSSTGFYDSLGESPTYTSLLTRTLFSRQSFPGEPACAAPCFAKANLGGCAATDNACLCSNQVFISSVSTCIEQTCIGSDVSAALSAGLQACFAVGVAVPTGPTTTAGALSPEAKTITSGSTAHSSSTTTSSIPTSFASSATSTISSGSSSAVTTSATTTPTASNGSNGMSNIVTAAITAGVVVGFVTLVLFAVGLWWWFCKRPRKKRSQAVAEKESPPEHSLARLEPQSAREDVEQYLSTDYPILRAA